MSLINKILTRDEIRTQPPVLLDIGASGSIHENWKQIAPFSICIAFDADDREFGYITKESSGFKKLYVFNCIVTDQANSSTDFFLTKSPFCSSVLEPDRKSLVPWAFAEKFDVDKKVNIKSISLAKALQEIGIQRVDWIKSDSQGTDLRLFRNLSPQTQENVIIAEFEPGIIDSYKGEDKFYELLSFMDKKNFWMCSATVKGSQRISQNSMEAFTSSPFMKKILQYSLKSSPGWVETVYFNTFSASLSIREYLLGWVFATIQKQYGFALEIAEKGYSLYKDEIFNEMYKNSKKKIWSDILRLKFYPAIIEKISKSL